MERTIGEYSKLIKSKREGGKNASNLIERISVHNHISSSVNIRQHLQVIESRQYNENSFQNLPSDLEGPQLWEPFQASTLTRSSEIQEVDGSRIINALNRFYLRSLGQPVNTVNTEITIAGRLLKTSTVYSTSMYRNLKGETSRGNHYIKFSCTDGL